MNIIEHFTSLGESVVQNVRIRFSVWHVLHHEGRVRAVFGGELYLGATAELARHPAWGMSVVHGVQPPLLGSPIQ